MAESFFERPILNSPYERPALHHALDADGQPLDVVSTGAADDLKHATDIALEMVTRHGMDDTVGLRVFANETSTFLAGPQGGGVVAAEASEREIDVAVRNIIGAAADRAQAILERRRRDLEAGMALLLKEETVTATEFPPLRVAAVA